jgi:hypothetical protein
VVRPIPANGAIAAARIMPSASIASNNSPRAILTAV